jgi:PilZ domain
METPSCSQALQALFAAGEVELTVPDGDPLVVLLLRVEDDVAWVLAPRLRVAGGRALQGRAYTSADESWLVSLAIESAEYASPELAQVCLRATAVAPHPQQRRAVRIPAGGSVWLEALTCQQVADGDRVEAVLVDLSPLGAAFTTDRVLRAGDQLRLHARVFSIPLDYVIRVASSRLTEDGRRLVGCAFLDMRADDAEAIERVARGEHAAPPPQLDLQALRAAAAPESGGLLGRFRRRA